jgi:2-iminobutanoate/2-iminopropanoate deaminase
MQSLQAISSVPHNQIDPKRELMSKKIPAGAIQDSTAGPYSPVLEVHAETLVVISGQVAVDLEGNVIGETIEEQTRATLENCRRQLTTAQGLVD